MRARLILTALWLGSLVVAWMLGSFSGGLRGPEQSRQTISREAARREQDLRVRPADLGARPGTDSQAGSTAPPDARRLPDFQAARSVDDVFDLLFRYYAAQLKRGPDGHRELLRALGKFQEDELLQERVRMDQEAWERYSYRLMRFLVRHEKEAIALLETMLEEAAANRAWFRALSPETFSTISDYWEYVPGMVDDKTLAHLRLLLE